MAGGGAELGFLTNAAVFLGAAVAAVPIFNRLGLGSVIGYLAAGAAIGPFGLGSLARGAAGLAVAWLAKSVLKSKFQRSRL